PPSSTPFPYTTLFRSVEVLQDFDRDPGHDDRRAGDAVRVVDHEPVAVGLPGQAGAEPGSAGGAVEGGRHGTHPTISAGKPLLSGDRKSTRLNSSHVSI